LPELPISRGKTGVRERDRHSLFTEVRLPDEWQGRVDVNLLKDVVSSLAPGDTSRFQTTRDGGLIVHLLSRQPVDEAKLKAELPDFTERLRAERRQEAANAWFRKEFELAHVSGPPEKKSAAQ